MVLCLCFLVSVVQEKVTKYLDHETLKGDKLQSSLPYPLSLSFPRQRGQAHHLDEPAGPQGGGQARMFREGGFMLLTWL